MSKLIVLMPTAHRPARIARRRLVARVGDLPVAAAVALGAQLPWSVAYAQTQTGTVIAPLAGSAATQTVVSTLQPGMTAVTTTTLRDGNAFNNFSSFKVGEGDTVKLVVPPSANWLINVVRDERVRVDGRLQGRLGSADGATGGNVLFIDSHGFAVGPNGRVEAGRLVFAAPSTTFVDGLLANGPGMSAQQVSGVLSGDFDRSDTGAVSIEGEIAATDTVQIFAGKGAGAQQAVSVKGRISVDGRRAPAAVNLGNLHSMAPVVDRDGVIEITTPGDVLLQGKLLADGSHWAQSGAVKVVAGGDVRLAETAQVSASAAKGSEGRGGVVSLFAQGSASNAPGAVLAARGDGAGSGGFIELSAAKSVQVGGLTMDAGSDRGAAGLAYIDPEDLLITSSLYYNGSQALLTATRSIMVGSATATATDPKVTLNTRKVADSTEAAQTLLTSTPTAASIGNSGSILIKAPSITIGANAVLDASVINSGGTTYTAGDIDLLASNTAVWDDFLLVGFSNADANIEVAGQLTGRNLNLAASIETDATYDGYVSFRRQKVFTVAPKAVNSPFSLDLMYTEATGDAKVKVKGTAQLLATEDISISAMADRSAGAKLKTSNGTFNMSAGFSQISGVTAVDIESGAELDAGRDIDLVAASKTTMEMNASSSGGVDPDTGKGTVAAVVFAGSMSDVTTRVNVAAGATLEADRNVNAQAFNSGQYSTKTKVTVYGNGTAGVVGALSLQYSETTATLGGQVTAGGAVSVMAMNASALNSISASSANEDEPPEGFLDTLPKSLELTEEDSKKKLAQGFFIMASKVAEEAEKVSSEGGSGSKSSSSSTSPLRLAGAVAWSESEHVTTAQVADGATVTATGNVAVDAQTLVGQLQSAAESAATSETDSTGTPVALSAAVNWGDHSFTTRASVGKGATVEGQHVAVNASADSPSFFIAAMPTKWDNFYSVYANLLGFQGGVFSPLYGGFNTLVSSSSAASNLAVSGAVNISRMTTDTRAWVDNNASITTTANNDAAWSYRVQEVAFDSDIEEVISPLTAPYRLDKDLTVLDDFVTRTRLVLNEDGTSVSYNGNDLKVDEIRFDRQMAGTVTVRSQNRIETLHMAGKPFEASSAGGDGVAVGGTFSMVDRQNTAVAGVADDVVISTRTLDVVAKNKDWALTITPSAGSGEGVAVNGMVSYTKLQENTLASISREAEVTATVGVNVAADLTLWSYGVTGGLLMSENSAVGVGVALNEIGGITKAYIGDNDLDAHKAATDAVEGDVGYVKTPRVRVNAVSEGVIGAVGVAGTAATSSQPPDPEEPPETAPSGLADKTADKVDTKSADAEAAANGSDGSLAALDAATQDMKSEGAGGDEPADASAPQADKAPPFQIAAAGAVVTNYSNVDTTALVDGALIKPLDNQTTQLAVVALSDLTQLSVAGGGALTMANNPSTKFSASIAGAVAIQDSDDDTTARVVGTTVQDVVDVANGLQVQALKSGERTAVATGVSANLSSGSSTSVTVVGSVSVTQTDDDTLASIEGSTITGKVATPTALDAQVVAYDRTRIGAGGGALSVSTGKGAAGVGAAVSVVDSTASAQAKVTGGSLTRLHDLSVMALSSQKVVGVGAVASVQTGSDSLGQLMGSFVFNKIGNEVSAGVTGGATVNLSGDLVLQAGGTAPSNALDVAMGSVRSSSVTDYEMSSTSSGYTSEFTTAVGGGESIVGVAGTLGVSLGNNSSSVGLSYAHNSIQTTYDAELNATVTAAGDVSVDATSNANIVGVAAGAGATKGKFSGMGSASVNLIGQRSRSRVTGGSVTASSLKVDSDTQGNQFGFAGNVSFAVGSGNGMAAGAAVAYANTGTRTFVAGSGAQVTTRAAGNEALVQNATVNVGSGDFWVQANNVSSIKAVAASGAATTGKISFAGTATWNEIGDVTSATIDNTLMTSGTVKVTAGEASGDKTSSIQSLAGGLAASKGFSGALAFGFNDIGSVRSASVRRSNLVVGNSVTVESAAQGSIETISATLAGGKDIAVAGSSSVNWLNADVSAELDGDADGVAGGARNTLSGTATTLTVQATASGSIESLAGSVSGAGTGAIGGALSVNLMGQGADTFRVRSSLANLNVTAPVATTVKAQLSGSIDSIAASGGGAGTVAINGSVTTNLINAHVLADVSNVVHSSNTGALSVLATNEADIASLAGTVGLAGQTAVGAAVSVNEIGGEVTAKLRDSALRATGAVSVEAVTSGDIRSVAAGVSGGGTAALAGSNTTNAITSTVLAQMDNVRQDVASASLKVAARDSALIESLAGTVSGGGSASGGAAFSLNFLGRTATNADSSKLVKAEVNNSTLRSNGTVNVSAVSTSTIKSAGVAAGASGGTSVTGSNTTNLLEDEVTASVSGSTLYGAATALNVQADDAATVHTLAGNFAAGMTGAVGAAIAVNQVGTVTRANLSDTTIHTGLAVSVDADLRGEIKSVAASGSVDGTAAVNGSFTTNSISANVSAEALRVTQNVNGSNLSVTADNDADLFSLAGTVSGAGTAAVGAAVAVNEVGGSVNAGLNASTVRATGNVGVKATSSGTIKSVAAGMGVGGAVALTGSSTTNAITSTVQAQMVSTKMETTAASLNVLARDTSTISSFAGTVTGGGMAGAGAALAINFLGRTLSDADSNKVVKALVDDSVVRASGDIAVNAYSTATIESIGVAAAAGGFSSFTGSNSTNILEDEIIATMMGSDVVQSAQNTISVSASNSATIDSLAGNVSGSAGSAVGAAIAINRIGTATQAKLIGTTNEKYANQTGRYTAWANDVVLSADTDNEIDTIAVGMSAGSNGTQGSVAVSVISSSTQAQMGDVGHVTNVIADDSIAVTANSRDRIRSLAGALSLGATGTGAAGGIQTNIISSTTSAGVLGNDSHVNAKANGDGLTVRTNALSSAPNLMNITKVTDSVLEGASYGTRTVKGLAVQATSIQQIGAMTAVAGGGAAGAAGASINVDKIGGTTRAYIDRARFVNDYDGAAAAQTTDVMAANHAMIASSAAALAIGGVGVSGALGTEIVERETRAEVLSASARAAGAFAVDALSTNTVAQISVGGAGGAAAGLAGSGDVVLLKGKTIALIDSSTVKADTVSVVADGANRSNLIAGSLGIGAVGAGVSFTVNVSGSNVQAKVHNSGLLADGAVVIDADNRTESTSVSASGGGGLAGIAVGAAVTVMEGNTEAGLTGTSTVSKRTLATGLVASANDAPVTIAMASDYDLVGLDDQKNVRFSLNDLNGRVTSTSAVVTVTDGEKSVTAVRQSDGTYSADVSTLSDGALLAQVVIQEGGVDKVSTTTLSKSTGINDSETQPTARDLPAASTRIATLSGFDQVDARNYKATRFVLKGSSGVQANGTAVVKVSDGTRTVTAKVNADGSYTADLSTLGDGVLTAYVTMPDNTTSRVTLNKATGAGALSVTADEHVTLKNNAGQLGVGGLAGIGTSANVIVGKSTVTAKIDASTIRVAGAVKVAAERNADIDLITVTGGAGGFAGVSGAVGVLVFGSAPNSNANQELTGDSSTLGSITSATKSNRTKGTGSALTESEASAVNTSASYDTQAAYKGATGSHRTSATVAAQSLVASSMTVSGLDKTVADNNAGAIALGSVAGISAGVAITQLGGANHAGVSVGSLSLAGDLNIESGTRDAAQGAAIESRAIAGAGGLVGIGAAVSVASNTSANTATLAGTTNAGGAIKVRALDEASMYSQAVGASAGADSINNNVVTIGVVTATAEQSGTVTTTVSGSQSGQGLSALAERDASTVAEATGGAGGVYAGSGAGASATDTGTVSVELSSGVVLDSGSGDMELSAKATPSASSNALGVSVAKGAAVGVSVALSNVETNVNVTSAGAMTLRGANILVSAVLGNGDSKVSSKAIAGGGGLLLGAQGAGASSFNKGAATVTLVNGAALSASGDVSIATTDSMKVQSASTGVGVGWVGAGVSVALTESQSTVSTEAGALSGNVAGNLVVSGRGDEVIDANAIAGTGGVIAGAGADARVKHTQNVTATMGTQSAGLSVGGRTTISADRKVRYDSQTTTVNASVLGGSGAVTKATLTGSATAQLVDKAKLTGAQLRVLATNDVERKDLKAISATGGGGGVLAGAGADVVTDIDGTALAEIGDDTRINLGNDAAGLLEIKAYNQLRGSSLGRLDLGGAIPIALVDTYIRSDADAQAIIGDRSTIHVAGETHVNALSYVDIEANTITKTYGAAAAAQGNANALANVTNQVTVGTDTVLVSEGAVSLLAGQDKDFWRNKNFVTARADLFNHSAIPVSINPDVDATLTLTNNLTVNGDAVRSGGAIHLGGISGTYVVEGKGKVSDWTRDVGELMGISSEYGSSVKNISSTSVLNGQFEAGFGNKQILVINPNGTIDTSKSEGNIRYSIETEDLAATGAAYLESLYNQLKNYGDIPEVRAFVEAEISFYLQTLVREGFATLETDPDDTSKTLIVPQESVPGTFMTIKSVKAGSGNIELYGDDVKGKASLIARADSEILIDNKSPMNLRVKDLIIDSTGGFAKYNGAYITSNADIAGFNKTAKTGLNITVDSIDTRGGASGESLPTIKVLNSYVPTGSISGSAVNVTGADGSLIDLRQDQMRAPEIRVNGLVYNKLGSILLDNTAGSVSVTREDANFIPRLDGLEIKVNAGKNFVLSSPTVSQSVGGSPESLYAVAYTDDQQTKLDNMGVEECGSARAGQSAATTFKSDCRRDGAGGIYASGGIFLGARYLNINGTIQSGQPDYSVTLTEAAVGAKITAWAKEWTENRGRYQVQGRSSLVQVSGRLPTDSEADVNKRFANGSITLAKRDELLLDIANRRKEPIVFYDAETNRLKVASTEVTGGLVELVGSIINTGGGTIRALDGYARFNIDNQTGYALDLLGLDTGGDAGVVRITDLSRPYMVNGKVASYYVTTYQRDANGAYKATTTAGRGATATVLGTSNSTLTTPDADRPELRATFNYSPVNDSTYVWSAGYEYNQEKRYWYQKSTMLWGAINLGAITWNSVETINKTASAMPEGIYVTTANAPSGTFWMGTQTITTATEREIYRRQWKKCGFLCFKKTFYVDYRTEVGKKDVFTQRVAADHPINIELVGYSTGQINVSSQADIGIAGKLTNESGLVSLTSRTGAITQLSGGVAVNGNDLRFKAVTGIGTQGSPVNVITGNGSFTAVTTNGNVAFQSLGGALRINEVSTTGKVWLFGDEDIVGVNPSAVHVRGSSIEISAPRGGIGTFNSDGTPKSTLNIQTEDSPGGGITAHAARGIAIKQATGNLWVNQVASNGGDVYIEAGGDLIDNNRNETRDLRTEAELLALWNAAALQGDSAEESRQLTLANTRKQFLRYWGLRNAQAVEVDPTTGAVIRSTADEYDPNTYAFAFTTTEKAQLAQSGLTTAQITSLETTRTQELKDLHALYGATDYQIDPGLIIAEVNEANVAAGRSAVDANATWTDKELKSPLPKAIFSKSTTDTQTRIEAPNVVGNRVVLKPGGKIGRDDGSVTIDLRKEGGLTVDDQLTIMSAESDDMVLDKTNWKLTVLKKDTFNVLSNRLNVTSNGFVYLGADATDAYPNGGDANLEQVNGKGEIRIKVSGSILNASTSNESVIQGYKAILEAATGSIGSAAKPVTMTLTGDVNRDLTKATLVARAKTGMWINQTGDIRIADVYSPANVNLTAAGAIIDARGTERTRSVEADEATLIALNGSVGTEANPIVVKMGSGGVNATSSSARSVYLRGADSSGLTVNDISSGLDIDLYAPSGNLRVRGQSTAVGRIDAQTEGSGDFIMDSGAWLRATTGDIYVSADDAGLSQLDASRAVVVVAQGAITDTSTDEINVNAAGRTVTLTAKGSIGTSAKPVDVLTKERTKLVATSRDGNAYLGSDLGIMRISQVSAKGDAFLSSAYAILDERGTRAQAVDATNVGFRAGGDVGQAAMPMTVKTAATGVVTQASATGSVYLKAPLGVLTVKGGSATNGQMALDGSTFGLVVDGTVTAKNGLSLTAGTKAITLTGAANLSNDTGRTLVQSDTITMLDGARLNGGAGTVVMSAINNITLTGVSSSNGTAGAIVVSTTRGSVIDAGDTNAYDLRVTSDTGGIQVTSYGKVGDASQTGTAQGYLDTDAPVLNLTTKVGEILVAQGRATRDVQITAKTRAELLSQGSVVGTKVAALGGDVKVTSALGGVKLTSLTSTRDVTVQAAGKIDLTSATAKQDLNLKSLATATGAGIQANTLTATRNANLTVLASEDAAITQSTGSLIQSLTASAGAITVDVAGTLDLRNAKSALDMTLLSKGNAAVGSASSTRGLLSLKSTGGSLQANSLSAATQLTLDSRTSISAGSLSAKTDLSVTAQTTATMSNFKVTAGGADFNIGSHFTLTSGTATGLISVDLGGWGSLGTLTSSRGALTATSGLGMRFNALKAASGITLLANNKLGYGVDAAYALIGNSVDGGTGSVSATAASGDIQLGRLTAKQASTVNATDGKVNVSAVSLPRGVKLNVSASGTKTLPAGYQ